MQLASTARHLLLACALGSTFATAAADGAAAAPPAAVQRIESRLAALAQDQRALKGVSAEGASVVGYRDGGALVKITLEALGERGKRLAEFHFERGRLLYAQVRRIDYGADITESLQGKALRADVVEDQRLSFSGGRLVQWLEGGQPVAAGDPRWKAMQADTLAEALGYRRLLQSPAPAGKDCEWACVRPQGAGCARYRCE